MNHRRGPPLSPHEDNVDEFWGRRYWGHFLEVVDRHCWNQTITGIYRMLMALMTVIESQGCSDGCCEQHTPLLCLSLSLLLCSCSLAFLPSTFFVAGSNGYQLSSSSS